MMSFELLTSSKNRAVMSLAVAVLLSTVTFFPKAAYSQSHTHSAHQAAQQGAVSHQNVLQYGNAYGSANQSGAKATSSTATSSQPVVVKPASTAHPANEPAQVILKHLLSANQIPEGVVERFEMDEDDVLNASTDGKNIYFTNKLWNTLENNDQRAFVLAHELSHITHNHVPKTMRRRIGLSVLGRVFSGLFGGSTGALANQAAQATMVLTELKFSRGAEYEADESGVQYMVNAGYDADGAIGTLEILEANSQGGTPQFLRSHPLSRNRIQSISEKYSQHLQE